MKTDRQSAKAKILREQNKLTQEDIGKIVGAERQTVSTWETGGVMPNIEVLVRLCEYFNVETDKLLYGSVVKRPYVKGKLCDWPPIYDYILLDEIKEAGFYNIIEENIGPLFPGVKVGFGHIYSMVLELKKIGYRIINVFGNGFAIYLRTDEEALQFVKSVRTIIDAFMHHDNEKLEMSLEICEHAIGLAKGQLIDEALKQIYKKDIHEYPYYWKDADDNLRGYAVSEKACRRQAKEQKCVKCSIFQNNERTTLLPR